MSDKIHSTGSSWLETWHVDPSVNRDYDFIDGLRGVAILMVLCDHCLYFNPKVGPIGQFLGALAGSGDGGVVLFYGISGFLISWPFWKRKFAGSGETVPPGYARRRFWKIYPPLALSLIVLTPVHIWISPDPDYFAIAAKWLVGLPAFLPVSAKLNSVMWTLVVEVQFYMILPVVFLLLKKIPARICLWLIPLIFLLVPVMFRAGTGLTATVYPEINTHFPSVLDVFFMGILVAGLDNRGSLSKGWASLGLLGVVAWPVAMLLVALARSRPELPGAALENICHWMEKLATGCLLFYIANTTRMVPRLLCAPALRWCGLVSYEWYLFHQPIFLWARHFLGPAEGNCIRYIEIVGGSLLFSGILAGIIYRYVSLPLLRYGRSRAKPGRIATVLAMFSL